MTETIDQLGPVDWLVVEFPGTDYGRGQVAPHLQDLVERGLVRVLDMCLLEEGRGRSLEMSEISDLDTGELGELRAPRQSWRWCSPQQDVVDLAETIEPGNSAALMVWENLWAAPFGSAVRKMGGQMVASGRIPTQAGGRARSRLEGREGRSLTMPLAARRRRRTAAAVGGAVVVAHGVNRRHDRREDRRDDRQDRRQDRRDPRG